MRFAVIQSRNELRESSAVFSRFFGAFNKIEICLTCLALLKWSKYAFNGISADILPSPRDETIWPLSSVPSLPLFRSLGRSETPPSSSFPMSPLSRVWERQLDTLCLFSLHFSPATFSLVVVVSVRLFCRNQCDLRTHFSSTWVSPKSIGKYLLHVFPGGLPA